MGILLSRTGIMEAQCFFLAGVYLMSILRPIEAWRMFVQAMACCQGFHTSMTAHGTQIEDEQKLQNSIYWTCFKSELYVGKVVYSSSWVFIPFQLPASFLLSAPFSTCIPVLNCPPITSGLLTLCSFLHLHRISEYPAYSRRS